MVLTAGLALAHPPTKTAHDLQQINPKEKVDVVVQFTQAPGQSDFDSVRGHGGELKRACL